MLDHLIGTIPDPERDKKDTSFHLVDGRIIASALRFFSVCVYSMDGGILFTRAGSRVLARNGQEIKPFFKMHLEASPTGIRWGLYEEVSVNSFEISSETHKDVETKLKILMSGLTTDEQIELLEEFGLTRTLYQN